MRNADVIVLVVDGVVGVAEEDDRVARMLRTPTRRCSSR